MTLAARWQELTVPEGLVYFVHDEDRLVTNPPLAAFCVLTAAEFAVLRALAAGVDPRRALESDDDFDAERGVERALGKLVLNWLVYLPEAEPDVVLPTARLNVLYYAITDGCNLRCPYCYASSEKVLPGELTFDQACDLVSQAAELGAQTIVFTGGEPFLRRDIFDVVGHAVSVGLRCNVITNGTLIRKPETAERIAELFSEVTVSMDGGTAEVHDRTRGVGAFERTAKALRMLNDAGVVPVINHIVTDENVDALGVMASFVGQVDVKGVRLMNHSKLGRGANDTLDFGWSHHLKVQDFCWTTPGGERLMPDIRSATRSCAVSGNCGMGGNEIYVTSQGDVYPCKLVTGPEHRAGNIKESRLVDVFDRSTLATLRRATVGKDHLVDCERCYVRGVCGGGCRAYHLAESGDVAKNSRNLCRILRQTHVSGFWLASGVDKRELAARRDEMTRPILLADDTEHPVFRDWQQHRGRRLIQVLDGAPS